MKSYNWGIIGPGNIARDFANDMKYVSAPQKITAVLSHTSESAVEFADEFNIAGRFTDPDDFFKKGKFDIVYIATPHPLHYEEIKTCLKNHIPVLCEKPIVLNYDQYEEVLRLSRENNTFLMEGMWVRFLHSFRKLLELLDQKKIGDIVSIKASMRFKAPRDENSRYYDPEKGGGSLLDLGVYCVFLSTLLMGRPKSIKSVGRLSDKKIDEACGILLSYKHGCYAMLESSLLVKSNGPAEIYGTEGVIRLLNPWFEKCPGIEVEMNNGDKENIPLNWEGHGLQFEIEEVINCVSDNKIESALMPSDLSGEVLKIMDEIREQLHVVYDADE
ncbi:MAG TPA: Gfo/Idh/MocA family oxidoreductase [Hanamia sp.]|nr:Gfo/Idh/MocA family oxidoreductase [Hanamia sp.]